jgi:cellulose biosynthesis protein BcsQ
MAKVIAIANQKGGCSKTTVTGNLGIGLALAGWDKGFTGRDPYACDQ